MDDKMVKLLGWMKEYPTLYEPSSALFWDDEHISEQMLSAPKSRVGCGIPQPVLHA